MKKTVLNKAWLTNEKGEFCGVDLGSDFCAEHESGIDLIKAAFNIDGIVKKKVTKIFGLPVRTKDEPNFGLSARLINTIPKQFVHGIAGKHRFIGFYDSMFAKWIDTLVKDAVRDMRLRKGSDFVAYWCDRGFLIVSDDQSKILELKEAFYASNIAIFLGNSNFISNRGFVIAIATKLDKSITDAMYVADKSSFELSKKVEAMGIYEKLKTAGKDYYALSPRWNDDKTDVIFWLNPVEQRKHHYGWFTLADLEAWINDEGPIIKKDNEERQD